MILIIHIILALVSIAQVTYAVFFPTKSKLLVGYFLTLSTVISGFIMGMINPASIQQVCVMGAIYFGLITSLSIIAKERINMKIKSDFKKQSIY